MASPRSTGVVRNPKTPNVDTTSTNTIQPLSPQDMRQKVVEILSNTANGCLQELGYYPGMSIRLQELEARNQKWQQENLKLYEDNKKLAEFMKVQADSIQSQNSPPGEMIKRVTHLELDNRALRAQLDQLTRARAAEVAAHEQRFAALNKEHTNLIEIYNRAYHEILRLRELCKTGRESQKNQDQNAFTLLSSQVPISMNGRRHPQTQMPPQSQAGHGFVPSQQQAGSASSHIIVSPANQQFFTQPPQAPMQQQQYQNQNRGVQQHIIPSSNHQRHISHSQDIRQSSNSPSMNAINFNGPLLNTQQQIPMHMSPSVSIHRPAILPRQNAPPFQTGPFALQSHVDQISGMGIAQNHRRASLSVLSTDHHHVAHNPLQSLFRPRSQPQIAHAGRTGSEPLPSQDTHITLPATPASAPPYPVSMANSFRSMGASYAQQAAPLLPSSGQEFTMPTTVAPNDVYIASPSNTLAAPVPTLPLSAQVPFQFSGSSSPPPPSTSHIGPVPSTSETMMPAPTQSGVTNPMASESNNASSLLMTPSAGSKREVTSLNQGDSENMQGNYKKQRLGSADISLDVPRTFSVVSVGTGTTIPQSKPPDIGVSSTASSLPSVTSAPADTAGNMTAEPITSALEQETDAEEEEEEVVEVGPDGLRLVEDILEQVYGQNRRGEVVCWFCKYRYEKGVTNVPPTVFNSASDQELEAHCITNHEVAWNQARASV